MKIKSNSKANKKGHINIICLIITMLVFLNIAACEGRPKNYEINSYDDFINALKEEECKVDDSKQNKNIIETSPFSVKGRNIKVNGETVTVYVFKDKKQAKLEADTITRAGYNIGSKNYEWDCVPSFYYKGNLIVSYIGKDTHINDALSTILDESIERFNVLTYNDLIEALKDMKYTINETDTNKDTETQSPFSVEGRNITVNGEVITVYEYSDKAKADADSSTIQRDGKVIGNKEYNWGGIANFYHNGNIIVSYIDKCADSNLSSDLNSIFRK